MSLDRIYVCCHKGDFRFAKICVASIQRWHPEVPVTVLIDTYRGSFSTAELRNIRNVSVQFSNQPFGGPFLKLLPLMQKNRERFLVLDADTCLVKRIPISILDSPAHFVGHASVDPGADILVPIYFDIQALQKFDPDYTYPGFYVNTGQFFGTSGIITRELLDQFVDWDARPVQVKDRNLFRLNEECLLNYLWIALSKKNALTFAVADFWHWSENLTDIHSANLPIVHWAGITVPRLSQMKHANYLAVLEKEFYSSLPFGSLRRNIAAFRFSVRRYLRQARVGFNKWRKKNSEPAHK
jgi:hypothetical protein